MLFRSMHMWLDGELSTMENEQVIQFDFSSDKRSEVSQAESEE